MKKNRYSAHEVLVWLMVFLALNLFVQGEIRLVTTHKQRIIRNGQSLQINCTAFGSEFAPNLKLKWRKVGSSLDIESRLVINNTLQLQIRKIGRSDDGEYQCLVMRHARVVKSTSVHVTVGDLPSKPSISKWRSVNWHICIHWNPVSRTGGLPVTYKIQYRCLSQCDLDDDENLLSNGWHEVCKNTLPTPGLEMKCCLDHVTIFLDYQAVVVAENALGNSTSSPVKFTRGIETTVGPPQSLRAQASGYGAITIDWTPPPHTSYWQIKYTIFYHAQGDSTNKTITLDTNGQNHYRLTGLEPYTKYTVYVAGIGPLDDVVGIPVGPVIALTKEENPSDAPEITGWTSKVHPENPSRRNVTVTWKLPPKPKWNGKIRNFIIQYRKVSRKRIDNISNNPWGETVKIDSSSGNKGTLSNLHSHSAYEVVMQMCNGAGCGGIGNKVIITAGLEQNELSDGRDVLSQGIIIIFLILTTFALLLIAVTTLVCVKIKSRNKQPPGQMTSLKCTPIKGKTYDRMEGEIPA